MKQRVKLLEKWLDVANHSLKIQVYTLSFHVVAIQCVTPHFLKDLTSMLAVVSGLGCAAVHRLKRTLKATSLPFKDAKPHSNMQCLSKSAAKSFETFSQKVNRRNLSVFTESMSPPGVPHLGIHLVELRHAPRHLSRL